MKGVLGSCDSGSMCFENSDITAEPSMCVISFFSDKSATMLKSTLIVAYSVDILLLNVSETRSKCLINN